MGAKRVGGWNWDGPRKRERKVVEGVEKMEPPGRQIKFSLRGRTAGGEPLPIVAFYMQSKAKLWGAETPTVAGPLCYLLTGSIIVPPFVRVDIPPTSI